MYEIESNHTFQTKDCTVYKIIKRMRDYDQGKGEEWIVSDLVMRAVVYADIQNSLLSINYS